MEIAQKFYVDTSQPGVMRDEWFDEMGGVLVGVGAQKMADMLNDHPDVKAACDLQRHSSCGKTSQQMIRVKLP